MWIWQMAWRDSRSSRRRLFLFVSAMSLGVAALVAIASFGDNLQRTVDEQSRTLLGADLELSAKEPFSPAGRRLIDSLARLPGTDATDEVRLVSLAAFPSAGGAARLTQVRALSGGYPYYGQIETDPAAASTAYQRSGDALVDDGLMQQFNVRVGDSVRVGGRAYRIAGRVLRTPGQAAAAAAINPRIFLPLDRLDTALVGFGSRADFHAYFRFRPGTDAEALRTALEPTLRRERMGSDTVEEIRKGWGGALANLDQFLRLVGLIALLLGGLGVASAITVYVRSRLKTVAVLRCLGATPAQTVAVYLIQTVGMGILAALVGAAIGVALQGVLPLVVGDLLPVDVELRLSPGAVGQGVLVGTAVSLLFALLPLVALRRVSPLTVLRQSAAAVGRDPLRFVVGLLVVAGLVGLTITQAGSLRVGLGYAAALGLVFGLLYGLARALSWAVRRWVPESWPYVWRQGLANLHRPANQTVTLLVALGLGTFLILTLEQTRRTLLDQVALAAGPGQPNLVLFDIQPDQADSVRQLTRRSGLTVLDAAPIVTMRLDRVHGRAVSSLQTDSTSNIPRWTLTREYRSTYRDHLTATETVTAGTFTPRTDPARAVVPISVEKDLARDLKIGLGDSLSWDVQGVSVRTVVGSIRAVEWRRVQPNFFIVFPAGVLEQAPQTGVLTARAEQAGATAALQRRLATDYPTVSAIDLSLVLRTVDEVFGRVSLVVRFMALFSILTGLVVLIGAVLVSRLERVGEGVLLKTLGASRRQVLAILAVEYLALGALATLTGLVLSLVAGWALARFVLFGATFTPALIPLAVAAVLVPALVLAVGLLDSRGVYSRSPLEVLRSEA